LEMLPGVHYACSTEALREDISHQSSACEDQFG
jgi:hypothetical protein